jgi:hypothetical protein
MKHHLSKQSGFTQPVGNQMAGFTLVEILVISPILLVIVAFTLSYLFGLFGQLSGQGGQINLQIQAQNITFSMQNDTFFANGYVSTINSNLVDSYQPSGGWQANSTPPTLIINTLSLTADHRNENRQQVYINTYGCSPQSTLEQNDVLFNNVIYFASGTNLYKRILTAPSSLATCGTNYQKQSCPAGNASPSCPADVLLSDKLGSFTLTYYDVNNTVVSTPEQAKKAKIDLQLHDTANGDDVYGNSSLTMRFINQ